MLNVTKISNREDAFLINYYTDTQKTFLIEGGNIATEMNKAFADIEKFRVDSLAAQRAQMSLAGAYLNYPQGAIDGGLLSANQVNAADTKCEGTI